MLILLLAWLSFDLATPLPGAFEFEADDSEIEDSIHVRREARGRRAAGRGRHPDFVQAVISRGVIRCADLLGQTISGRVVGVSKHVGQHTGIGDGS